MQPHVLTPIPLDEFFNRIAHDVAAIIEKHQHNQAPDDFLTQSEACKLLKCSKSTLISWASKGLVSPRKLDRRVYYLRSQLMGLVTPS